MPDIWSEIMSTRLARRAVTRAHADALMGKKAVAPAAVAPKPEPVKAQPVVEDVKVEEPIVEETVVEESAPAPKTKKSAAPTTDE